MKVSNIVAINFKNNNMDTKEKAKSFLDNVQNYTKNTADMTDTIVVPRTIFKGYLGIMAGTTLVTIGSLLSGKMSKFGRVLSISGLLTSMYGTWAFVRPFVIKDAPGVSQKK